MAHEHDMVRYHVATFCYTLQICNTEHAAFAFDSDIYLNRKQIVTRKCWLFSIVSWKYSMKIHSRLGHKNVFHGHG